MLPSTKRKKPVIGRASPYDCWRRVWNPWCGERSLEESAVRPLCINAIGCMAFTFPSFPNPSPPPFLMWYHLLPTCTCDKLQENKEINNALPSHLNQNPAAKLWIGWHPFFPVSLLSCLSSLPFTDAVRADPLDITFCIRPQCQLFHLNQPGQLPTFPVYLSSNWTSQTRNLY